MITERTQAAIALLHDIYIKADISFTDKFKFSEQEKESMLQKLVAAQLISLEERNSPQRVQAYKPMKKFPEISLLEVIEALGEHIDFNQPATESFYTHYGRAALKLGIVNHMTRLYLSEIKLCDI